jgi:hypothetical protein
VFAGTEGNLPSLIASSKFTISEGFATTTITYRDQETPVPLSNSALDEEAALETRKGARAGCGHGALSGWSSFIKILDSHTESVAKPAKR